MRNVYVITSQELGQELEEDSANHIHLFKYASHFQIPVFFNFYMEMSPDFQSSYLHISSGIFFIRPEGFYSLTLAEA